MIGNIHSQRKQSLCFTPLFLSFHQHGHSCLLFFVIFSFGLLVHFPGTTVILFNTIPTMAMLQQYKKLILCNAKHHTTAFPICTTVKPLVKTIRVGCRRHSSKAINSSPVWVITDGGIESTLQALVLGRHLAGSSSKEGLQLKTMVINKKLELLPVILQKYFIDWQLSKYKKLEFTDKLPWFLTSSSDNQEENNVLNSTSIPAFIITSGHRSIPACLYYTNLFKRINEKQQPVTSVYVGYPNLPFIHFDQVVLPKYEANGKMAHLGPLARQKNGIIAPAPLVDNSPAIINNQLLKQIPFGRFTSVIVGGHSPFCRWYSEDAVMLTDNIKVSTYYFFWGLYISICKREEEH
ncbi:hypothetical protein BDF20DRAFT_862552 [Mycotypha africana]|uniref:uncharacterized protein n=1 Tax=Mycotypha africana TaxID=64632 RepID=UPI002300177C|nr:uncharacterized protein BDF20DRAFT_862552 [Mycotypha africana]KAI8981661.1 hypothetical protein BDF20DRAFT_862552 [Mycotypha africana]